jgi:hypothetical protein
MVESFIVNSMRDMCTTNSTALGMSTSTDTIFDGESLIDATRILLNLRKESSYALGYARPTREFTNAEKVAWFSRLGEDARRPFEPAAAWPWRQRRRTRLCARRLSTDRCWPRWSIPTSPLPHDARRGSEVARRHVVDPHAGFAEEIVPAVYAARAAGARAINALASALFFDNCMRGEAFSSVLNVCPASRSPQGYDARRAVLHIASHGLALVACVAARAATPHAYALRSCIVLYVRPSLAVRPSMFTIPSAALLWFLCCAARNSSHGGRLDYRRSHAGRGVVGR